MVNTIIADNGATNGGDGLYVQGTTVDLRHSTIARNHGGAGSGICIVADDYDDRYSQVWLTNTVLVSHTVGVTISQGNVVWLEGTLWGDGAWANVVDWAGTGVVFTGTINRWGDPAFVDAAAGGYHLGPGSAALDQGLDLGVPLDIDDEPRPYQAPDLGADEYWPPGTLRRVYLPLTVRLYRP